MVRHLGNGTGLLCVAGLATAFAVGCGGLTSKPPGVTPPVEETREHVADSVEKKVELNIGILHSERRSKTFAAAKHLGEFGAEAARAIPRLRELVKMEPNEEGFPDTEQKAAYQAALDKIIADMNAKGLPIPAEGAPASGEAKK